MKYIEYNLNRYAKVKLTAFGKAIIKEYYKNSYIDFPHLAPTFDSNIDKNGYYKIQFHLFMRLLGSHMVLGNERVLEDFNVKLEVMK